MEEAKNYFELLKTRRKKGHVYRNFQFTGLSLAKILQDEAHRTLYISLAKKYNATDLLNLAKRVADKSGVRNQGAYFMKLFAGSGFQKTPVTGPVKVKKKKSVQKTIFDVLKKKNHARNRHSKK